MKNRSRIIGAAMLAVTMACGTALAQNIWTGASSDSYNDAGNWSQGAVPDGDATTNAYIVIADTSVNGTINYGDGETNSVRSTEWYGGMTLNQTGGYYNSTRSGNSVRDWVGKDSTALTTFNLYGGKYQSSHIMRVGIGGEGEVNLDGGYLLISRGGNGVFGNGTSVSLSVGQTTTGTVNITSGTLETRVGVELGGAAVFNVEGAGSTIAIGANGSGDGDWFQNSNAVLRVGISTNGISPIVLTGAAVAKFKAGAVLDVGFIDGAMETGSWPVMVNTNGTWSNLGMVPAAGVDTNDWGFIISNNVMYVGYGLDWPFGEEVLGPPDSQRTLYWTGGGGDTDAANATNWVLDATATLPATWGPYDNDIWRIADIAVVGVELGTDYVVDYSNSAANVAQRDLEIGISAQGTFNMNAGDLTFTSHSSSRQEIGLNANGDGTINMNVGNLTLNAARFGVSAGQGTLNLNGGTFVVSRGYGNIALWLGHGGTSTGTVNVVGGRMFTRSGVKLGDGGSAIGIFNVEGSVATDIGIGQQNTLDGMWTQNSGSILKVRMDEGGITPIRIVEKDAAIGGDDGNVYFNAGSILDVGWMPGVTNYNTFDVMTWDGMLVESNLTFAAGVDTSIWSFEFVDANSDGTNDTLRAEAYGETANGTPYGWLNSYDLTVDDDEVDNDTDGLLTYEEYIAGTIPTDSNSVLVVNSLTSPDGVNAVISWQSVAGKSYSIFVNDDLVNGTPTEVGSDIIGLETETSVTSSIPAAGSLFYQIGVE